MLSAEQRDALNRMGPYASAYDLGKIIHQTQACAVGTWTYATAGGAVGNFNLKDINGVDLKIPSGAIITNVLIHATLALTSSGSATVDVNVEAADDCAAAVGKASLTLGANVQGIPDFATVGDYVTTTAERTPTISINTAAATAGTLAVYFWYLLP
jgi:hypothetical protein